MISIIKQQIMDIFKLLKFKRVKRKSIYGSNIFRPRTWLEKEVEEQMFRKSFGL